MNEWRIHMYTMTPSYVSTARSQKDETQIGRLERETESWMIITGLFSDGLFEKKRELWKFRIPFCIAVTISDPIFLGTRGSFIAHRLAIYDTSHSWVRHDSSVTWLVHVCAISPAQVYHDSVIRVPWLTCAMIRLHACRVSFIYVP
jgi:hypothetical protein